MASFVFDFQQAFKSLTGNNPFPWQEALFEKMSGGLEEIPPQCNLPTGLGKTSIIAVWLIALAQGYKVPRRLVYVVNRRTVVDQTTEEVERYAQALVDNPELKALRKSLEKLCALPLPIDNDGRSVPPLAISTLRGQFADNREWSTDPTRPAVICGTVDMIGSRLLFSGYGVGWKSRPLHAGFLGQDTLLVHDEAHLEPAFQRLIEGIEQEQRRSNEFGSFRVLELTATAREAKQAFAITSADKKNRTVHKRFHATKNLRFHKNSDEKKLAEEITALALAHKNSGRPILIFVQTAKNVLRIRDLLAKEKQKDNVVVLTGTMRGEERDKLAKDLRFQRFLPKNDDTTKDPSEPYPGTVYLICTSAGEVGVNISADHLVCDLTTFESMAQRFGRVNRFGEWDDTRVDLIHPTKFDHDDPHDARREKTLELLKSLDEDASPAALDKLDPTERAAAFAPELTLLTTTDILFDAWSLTSIRCSLPGRPPVEPFLHGLADWQPPETQFAWRQEVVELNKPYLLEQYAPAELLEAYPLLPRELLRLPSSSAFDELKLLAKQVDCPAWLVGPDGNVVVTTVRDLADKDRRDRLDHSIVILPPTAGGLNAEGLLDGTATEPVDDVSETVDRFRQWTNEELSPERAKQRRLMHRLLRIEFENEIDDVEDSESGRVWEYYAVRNEGDRSSVGKVDWDVHVGDVERNTAEIVKRLSLPKEIRQALLFAAKYHDHGKRRKIFQRVLGNFDFPNQCWAKSGKNSKVRLEEKYRHEFGSLIDMTAEADFKSLTVDQQQLVLHLVAAHHGRARPHFPLEEAMDPHHPLAVTQEIAASVPQRFARLQRKYGRWGLAYLESLLRAADWHASSCPSQLSENEL